METRKGGEGVNYFYSYNEHDDFGKVIGNGHGIIHCEPQFVIDEVMMKIRNQRISQDSTIHIVSLNKI